MPWASLVIDGALAFALGVSVSGTDAQDVKFSEAL